MIDDDDLFVVIVDDVKKEADAEDVHKIEKRYKSESSGSYSDLENDCKLEYENQINVDIDFKVENILDAAQEYGEILHFKEDTDHKIEEVLDVSFTEEDYETTFVGDEDDDYDNYYESLSVGEDSQSNGDSTDRENDETSKRTHWRHKNMVMVSYVQKLREKFPHLSENKEYLIRSLAHKMKYMHAPDPPPDFVTFDDDNNYRCKFCFTVSSTQSIAERHYQEKHGERYLTCYACGATFRWSTNLYKHEQLNCRSRDISIVLKARALYMRRKGRSRPAVANLSDTPRKRYSCPLCTATFANKNSLEPHMRMHRGERPFRCAHCPRAYTSQVAMNHHMKKHGSIKFVCDHCGKIYKEKGKLVVHLESHAPKKKYGCEECPKRYCTKADLTVHINCDHKNLPLPYDCKICPKRFARMATLKSHMKKTHGMVIITSRMFARRLPEMSEKQLETQLKEAIVVLKNPNSSSSIIEQEEM